MNFIFVLFTFLFVVPLFGMNTESVEQVAVKTILLPPNDPLIINEIRHKELELALLRFNKRNALSDCEIAKAQNPNQVLRPMLEHHLCCRLVKIKKQEINSLKIAYPIESKEAQEHLAKCKRTRPYV